jgi:hypothetical protein
MRPAKAPFAGEDQFQAGVNRPFTIGRRYGGQQCVAYCAREIQVTSLLRSQPWPLKLICSEMHRKTITIVEFLQIIDSVQ